MRGARMTLRRYRRAVGSTRRSDQAFAGDDHPAAVLTPDLLDAAGARQGRARLHLDDAATAFYQGHAIEHFADDVVFQNDGLGLGFWRRHRAGHVAVRLCRRASAFFEPLNRLADLANLRRGLRLRALGALEALADLAELRGGGLGGLLRGGAQRRDVAAELRRDGLERLNVHRFA